MIDLFALGCACRSRLGRVFGRGGFGGRGLVCGRGRRRGFGSGGWRGVGFQVAGIGFEGCGGDGDLRFAYGSPVAVARQDQAAAAFRDGERAVGCYVGPFAVFEEHDAAVGVGQDEAVRGDVHTVVRLEGIDGRRVEFNLIVLEIGQNAAGAEQAVGVVAFRVDAAVAHAVVGGVDEFRVVAGRVEAGEDTHVADYLRVTAAAQQEDVAFLQVAEVRNVHLAAIARLILGRTVEVEVAEVVEDVTRVAGAVEALRPVRAVAVGCAEEGGGIFEDLVGQLGGREFDFGRLALIDHGFFLRACFKGASETEDEQERGYEGCVFHLEE